MGVIWGEERGFSIIETTNYKTIFHFNQDIQIKHLSLLYRTLSYAIVTANKPY